MTTKRSIEKRLEGMEPDVGDDPALVVDLCGTGQAWRDGDGPSGIPDRNLVTESGGIHVLAEVDK